MRDVSVLVPTLDPGAALPSFVKAIDAQTLPAAGFELVLVDASGGGSSDRLRQLAGRRPNVTVLTAEPGASEADRLALALEGSSGRYLLVVGQQQRLAPRALELLLDRARVTGADLVLGRAPTGVASGCAVLPDDADRLDVSGLDLTGCVALVRRESVEGRPDPGAALLEVAALPDEGATAAALGRYACAARNGDLTEPGDDVTLERPAIRWREGTLQVDVGVRLPEDAAPDARAWLVLTRGLAEIALPATTAPGEGNRPRLAASAVLDPESAEGGHPLEDGPWKLLLRLAWPSREVTLPLTAGGTSSAVVAGRPHVVRVAGAGVQLDAGATRSSVIGPVAEPAVTVVESVRGTLVTFDHPDVHVHGDAVLDARLLLGGFGLPARLVCRNGRARLEAYASSLAGTSAVSVVAGGGKPVPTGLRLRVSGTGAMTFRRMPTPAPAPAPAPASARKPSAGRVPLAQRLRRRAPGALDPVLRRLVEVPVVRRAYRRLINR